MTSNKEKNKMNLLTCKITMLTFGLSILITKCDMVILTCYFC